MLAWSEKWYLSTWQSLCSQVACAILAHMAIVQYSRTMAQRILTRIIAVLLLVAGFFLIFFVSTPRAFKTSSAARSPVTGSPGLATDFGVAYADAPAADPGAGAGTGGGDGGADSSSDGCP